jgi:hypothetical protein
MVPAGLPSHDESPDGPAIRSIPGPDDLDRASRPILPGLSPYSAFRVESNMRVFTAAGSPIAVLNLGEGETEFFLCVFEPGMVLIFTQRKTSCHAADGAAAGVGQAWSPHRKAEWNSSPGAIGRDARSRSSGPGTARMTDPSGLAFREGSPKGTLEPAATTPARPPQLCRRRSQPESLEFSECPACQVIATSVRHNDIVLDPDTPIWRQPFNRLPVDHRSVLILAPAA